MGTHIPCASCGEEYEGIFIDMLPWQKSLFLKGAGCPCCESLGDGTIELMSAHIRARVIGGLGPEIEPDEIEEMFLVKRPEWREPDPTPIEGCKCAGCNVSVAMHPEDNEPVWFGGDSVHHYRGGTREYGGWCHHEDATTFATAESWRVVGDDTYCPGCVGRCCECNEVYIFTGASDQADDPYSLGYGFPHPGNPLRGSVCVHCYEESEESSDPEV
jgi:hypothetical protein